VHRIFAAMPALPQLQYAPAMLREHALSQRVHKAL
jgi:hypothetical protein